MIIIFYLYDWRVSPNIKVLDSAPTIMVSSLKRDIHGRLVGKNCYSWCKVFGCAFQKCFKRLDMLDSDKKFYQIGSRRYCLNVLLLFYIVYL